MDEKSITILHFNDVYNIEPQVTQEPQGGAARMSQYVKSVKDLNPLVLFSGDAFNPSLMSIFLKGEQMVPVLNAIGVHCAVYGNHDFDFGVDHLEDMAERSEFPWLLSNIIDKTTNLPLAHGKVKHMIDWHGVKVGLVGLVEQEWIDTLATVDPEDVIFLDFVETGNKLAAELREEGADIVVALTHMRWPNDRKVAREVDVDIVLGGHDHDYIVEQVNGKYVVKSGTDFRNLSSITMTKNGTGFNVDIKQVDLDSSLPQDVEVKQQVDKHVADIHSKMDELLGNMGVEMDGRFASIRTRETNLGNFITDIILEAVPADICMLNSGTFRSDRIHSKGPFKLRDLMTILPMVDLLCVIEISGSDIIKALENGVSQFPKLEGRFPQVAGMTFGFDASKPPGQRIEPGLVKVQGEHIIPDKKYRLCTKEYIAGGKDGYDVFKDCPVVESSEQCPSISTAARNHFESVQIVRNEKPCRSGHRQSLCSIVRRSVLIQRTISAFSSGLQSPKDNLDSGVIEKSLEMFAKPEAPAPKPVIEKQAGIYSGTTTKKASIDSGTTAKQASVDLGTTMKEVSINSGKTAKQVKVDSGTAGNEPSSDTVTSGKRFSFKTLAHTVVRQMSISEIEKEQKELCPKVEGRIFHFDDEKRLNLLNQRGPLQQSIMDEIIQASSSQTEKLIHLSNTATKTRSLAQESTENMNVDSTNLKRKQSNNNNNPTNGDGSEDVKKAKLH